MNTIERFLNYVKFDTSSDFDSETSPSTQKQKKLGEYIAKELSDIGAEDVLMDKFGYVYAALPASEDFKDREAIGFLAHMDTSPDVSGKNVSPVNFVYNSGDIKLSEKAFISAETYPFLKNYIGEELIVTDGTTLLGADDKAGIAEIVSAAEYLLLHKEIKHGKICICITPDEEIGRGTEHFSTEKFGAKYAYTVDGGTLGEIEYENFNAAAAEIFVHGINIHPGSAKNKMRNAVLLANELISMLPPAETPACTEGYEGFYHVSNITSNESEGRISLIIRDHDMEKFESKKNFLSDTVLFLNKKYGEGTFEISLKDTYYNMKEKIKPFMFLIDNAKKALEKEGIAAKCVPIRGGTDGAALSFMGIPCPNLCTGGENYHSIHEFIPVSALQKMTDVLIRLMTGNI